MGRIDIGGGGGGVVNEFIVGSFTRDTALVSGDQVVSGLGFEPDLVLFIMASSQIGEVSVGFDDLTNTLAIAKEPDGSWGSNNVASIRDLHTIGGSDLYDGVISATADGQFTITWTRTGTPTGTINISYCAMKLGG